MKLRVSSSIVIVKWRCIEMYSTGNRLGESEVTYKTLVNSKGYISCSSTAGMTSQTQFLQSRPQIHQQGELGCDVASYGIQIAVLCYRQTMWLHFSRYEVHVITLLCSARASPQRPEPLLADLHPWNVPEHRSRGHLHCSLTWGPGVSCTV